VFHVFGALASFERELIQERTLAGLAAARERGRLGGRPSALSPAKLKQARKMNGEKTPVTEVAQVLGVSRGTLYRGRRAVVTLRPMEECSDDAFRVGPGPAS